MKYIQILSIVIFLFSCGGNSNSEKLPILGEKYEENGQTVYHKIPDFAFINQDSAVITNETIGDRAYVVDFFFTSCPTICPKVKQQMIRLYDKYNEESLFLLSHSIDTKRDTVARLKEYADKIDIESNRWSLVTGEKEDIYEIADDYFSVAIEDADAPGGFDHSGRLILVDRNRYVRAFCNGTDEEEVTVFMEQIDQLLAENNAH